MKVTHVITPINYGGGENLIINLIEKMDKSIDNSVLNLSYSEEFEKHLSINNTLHKRISNKNLGSSPSKQKYLLFLVSILFQIFFVKNKIDGEIVHAHGFPANIFISFMKKLGLLKNKKIIFTSHSEKKSEKAFVRKFYLFFLREFDSITCVGEKSFESMNKIFPELKDKIVKINNGIKTENFYYKEKDYVLKESLGFSKNDIVAIYVSRLSSVKNHKFLIKLIKKINIENFKLLIIGEGEEKNNLIDLTKELNLQDKIRFEGFVKNEELSDYYGVSDIVLFPSSSEGFGISLVEAIGCRKPLVLFDNIYFKELKDSVFISKDENEFYKNTLDLINSEELRLQYGLRGEIIKNTLSIESCAKNYENLYRSL